MGLEGWSLRDSAIEKRYRFDDFQQAFAWMTLVAGKAEELDHHPKWTNVYAKVDVTLWTHDAGGVTELDFLLARAMDELAGVVRSSA